MASIMAYINSLISLRNGGIGFYGIRILSHGSPREAGIFVEKSSQLGLIVIGDLG